MAKDPGLAVLAAVLFPGGGQLYTEQWLKAVVVFIAILASAFLIAAGIGLILFPLVWVYSVWDAYSVASGGTGWP